MTKEFLSLINHPIALAIWYCDDGSYTKSSLQFSTESFSREENILLVEWLYNTWGIRANLSSHGEYWRLTLPKNESIKFLNLTWKYILRGMPRKLPPWYKPE